MKSVNIEVELSPNCHMKCTNADFCKLVLLILNYFTFFVVESSRKRNVAVADRLFVSCV